MNDGGRSGAELQLLDSILTHLRRDAEDERIREMAADLLDGRVTLAEAMSVSAYADAFESGVADFFAWHREADEGQTVQEVERYRKQFGEPDERELSRWCRWSVRHPPTSGSAPPTPPSPPPPP